MLCDNHTYIDQYYLGEPAFSCLIEDGDQTILFDTAYSDTVPENARRMGIPLVKLNTLVLSHGHCDHTRGLIALQEVVPLKNVRTIAGPGTFDVKILERPSDPDDTFGSPWREEEVRTKTRLTITDQPMKLSDYVTYSGFIPRQLDFDHPDPIGQVIHCGKIADDEMEEEAALYLETKDGIFIVSACAHRGICNIIERARDLFPDQKIAGVLGGFHLFKVDERLEKTIDYLEENGIDNLYPCHSVSFRAKSELHQRLPVHEVGVGMRLELEPVKEGQHAE